MRENPLPKTSPMTIVTMFDVRTCLPVFDVMLYGVSTKDVCVVVAIENITDAAQWVKDGREGRRELCGSEYVRAALRRRGLDPDDFASSIFAVRDGAGERQYLRRDG